MQHLEKSLFSACAHHLESRFTLNLLLSQKKEKHELPHKYIFYYFLKNSKFQINLKVLLL